MKWLIVLATVMHCLCLCSLAQDRLWTHAEIVADMANPLYTPDLHPDCKRTCKLKLMTEESPPADPHLAWIVTKHGDIRVAVYSKQQGGYRLATVLLADSQADTRFWDNPKWTHVLTETYGGKTSRRVKLFCVTESWMGTGNFPRHHVFVEQKDRLIPVKWVSPVETLPWRLREGQGVWKGIGMSAKAVIEGGYSNSTLGFGFAIWNKGDGNCCPTGGDVTGEFGLFDRGVQPNGDPFLELRARNYRWEPSEHTDLLSFGEPQKSPDDSNDDQPTASPPK